MTVVAVPLRQLRPAQWNPRLIKDGRFKQLCRSLEADPDFLWQRPVLAQADGTIYAGNMRYRAAEALGWTEVPAIVADVPEQLAKERGLRDNNQYGEWQEQELAELLYELDQAGSNLDLLGFEQKELERLIESVGVSTRPDDPGAEVDRAEELRAKWQTASGQLWEIPSLSVAGKCHRLLCGDSTKAEDVDRLMGGERAVLFATDPPYGANAGNIGYTAQRDDIEVIAKDDLEGTEMQAFLESAFRVWMPYLNVDCAWYLWHPMLTQGYFAAAAAAADLIIHRQIIWRKEQFIFGRGDYHWRHELCFYGWRKGHRPPFHGERNQDTVWDIPWGEKRSDVGHPTAKPPDLFIIPMRNHTSSGAVCAEPFSGSGSQFVAGEQVGRLVYGCELEPKYVAVALERLSKLGLEPRLAGGG